MLVQQQHVIAHEVVARVVTRAEVELVIRLAVHALVERVVVFQVELDEKWQIVGR